MEPDSNRLTAIDAAAVFIVSVAICLASDKLLFMTVFVPLIISARMIAVAAVARSENVNMKAEVLFFIICTILGAFNDWNSVCNKRIYDYTVPHYFDFSTIPVWMLLFWGMILRFIARFARWRALDPGRTVSNRIGIGAFQRESAAIKVIAELSLVLVTRQVIYRYYMHPFLSWIPFAAALLIFILFFHPSRHDLKLMVIFIIGGPLVEILFINVGHLHDYHIGWLAGVPLWIVIWWLLIVLIWKDLAFRTEVALRAASR